MYDENQIVQVKWNNTNREWYESKGYVFTKRYDYFNVSAKDLSPRSDIKIKAICDYCGNDYETSFVVLMDGRKKYPKDCCSYCAGKKTSDISRRKRAIKKISLAQHVCKENGYVLLTTVDDYIDSKMDASFICSKHGLQTMILDNLINGHKCIDCSYEQRGDNLKHDVEYIKQIIESINGNILLNSDDYKDTNTRNLLIKCSCGNEFTTSFANYSKHNVNTCYSCSCKESSGEQRIRKFLESNNIEFVQEKRFDDCRDIRPLPFDFYLPNKKLIIEFDGLHHFEETGRGNHKITKKHDVIKNQYCQSHNIDLIRIPYWEGSNIENIISDKLNL